jgi:hypothetical protein
MPSQRTLLSPGVFIFVFDTGAYLLTAHVANSAKSRGDFGGLV